MCFEGVATLQSVLKGGRDFMLSKLRLAIASLSEIAYPTFNIKNALENNVLCDI